MAQEILIDKFKRELEYSKVIYKMTLDCVKDQDLPINERKQYYKDSLQLASSILKRESILKKILTIRTI